ncbi:MAG: hypothetical protein AB1758_35900 [Candidatus Eremiobacterota bacterium]
MIAITNSLRPLSLVAPQPSASRPAQPVRPESRDQVILNGARDPDHPPHDPPEHGRLSGTLAVNGQDGAAMQAGQPALWRLRFADPHTGEPVREFDIEHEKPMHAIVVSQDLETFAHLHPYLNPDGTFHMPVNETLCDPDNRDAVRAVTKAGPHFVFAEVKPKDRGVEMHRFRVEASGPPAPVAPTPDPVGDDGLIRKYFTADGQPGQAGDFYEVTVRVDDHRHHGMLHVNYTLKKANEAGGYDPVRDAENWLGMPGHGVFIGAAGETADARFFAHLHAGHQGGHAAPTVLHDGEHGAGPDFMFMLHGEMPPDGVYKMWGQFKREGQVLTFPVTFELFPHH